MKINDILFIAMVNYGGRKGVRKEEKGRTWVKGVASTQKTLRPLPLLIVFRHFPFYPPSFLSFSSPQPLEGKGRNTIKKFFFLFFVLFIIKHFVLNRRMKSQRFNYIIYIKFFNDFDSGCRGNFFAVGTNVLESKLTHMRPTAKILPLPTIKILRE